MERRVSRDECGDDTVANEREGTEESEVVGGVAEGEVYRKLDIRGGGLERKRWEEGASRAGGGGEGRMLSVRAS